MGKGYRAYGRGLHTGGCVRAVCCEYGVSSAMWVDSGMGMWYMRTLHMGIKGTYQEITMSVDCVVCCDGTINNTNTIVMMM